MKQHLKSTAPSKRQGIYLLQPGFAALGCAWRVGEAIMLTDSAVTGNSDDKVGCQKGARPPDSPKQGENMENSVRLFPFETWQNRIC